MFYWETIVKYTILNKRNGFTMGSVSQTQQKKKQFESLLIITLLTHNNLSWI